MKMQPILYIVCGLPGSGKSTIAGSLSDRVFSADDFFMVGSEYRFDPKLLSDAHHQCQARTEFLLSTQHSNSVKSVAVANTFTQFWEVAPYWVIAKRHSARVVIVDCFDGGMTDAELAAKNVHGVPQSAIAAMRYRYEFNKYEGDSRPPWQRK